MERFNLNTWLEDKRRKIVTRDGKPARIICYDVKQGNDDCYVPIIALVDKGEEIGEMSYYYSEDGSFLRNHATTRLLMPAELWLIYMSAERAETRMLTKLLKPTKRHAIWEAMNTAIFSRHGMRETNMPRLISRRQKRFLRSYAIKSIRTAAFA